MWAKANAKASGGNDGGGDVESGDSKIYKWFTYIPH